MNVKRKKTNRKDNRKAKALLTLHNIPYLKVAAKAGVHETTVSVVLGGHGHSENIKKAVFSLLQRFEPELTSEELWGENHKAV